MSVSNPRGFLEGLSSSFFDVAQMTSIDVYSKNVGDLTLRDDLAVQIIRARFVGCRLSGLPNGLGACRNIVSLDLTENNIETLPNDALSPFLSLENLAFYIRHIPWTDEVSIGHALISDALYYGLENTVGLYLRELKL